MVRYDDTGLINIALYWCFMDSVYSKHVWAHLPIYIKGENIPQDEWICQVDCRVYLSLLHTGGSNGFWLEAVTLNSRSVNLTQSND